MGFSLLDEQTCGVSSSRTVVAGSRRLNAKIIVASHRVLVAELLSERLRQSGRFGRIIATSSIGEVARLLGRTRLAVVMLDLCQFDSDEFAVARSLKRRNPSVRIVMMADHPRLGWIQRALYIPVDGLVVGCDRPEDCLRAIESVVRGHGYLSPCVARTIMETAAGTPRTPFLTIREVEVLDMMCQGRTAKESARRLGLSSKTIEAFRSAMMSKVGCRNGAGLVRYGVEQGYAGAGRFVRGPAGGALAAT